MLRMPIPCRRSFQRRAMRRAVLCGIRPSFPGLFPCRGQVAYVLLTSAPVVIRSVATPMLPLDLHVLSLSLAFILSQDQTLRCQIFFFSLSFKRLNKDTRHASSRPRRMSVLLATFQGKQRGDFLSLFSLSLVLRISLLHHFYEPASGHLSGEKRCKITAFYVTGQILSQKN